MRVLGANPLMRNESERYQSRAKAEDAVSTGAKASAVRFVEHVCWDPKDGELYLSRAKPEETLVEARKRSDVQIDVQTWV
jgi:hypothetical protein